MPVCIPFCMNEFVWGKLKWGLFCCCCCFGFSVILGQHTSYSMYCFGYKNIFTLFAVHVHCDLAVILRLFYGVRFDNQGL